jgi:5-methylcytosine-specific restriction endonuclease McrA
MTELDTCRTLVLNADYQPLSYFPLSVCSWQDAIKALMQGRVEVVSEYEYTVRSPSLEVRVPSVVCIKRYVGKHKEHPVLTRYNLFLRDRFECQYCGDRFDYRKLTIDHVTPRCRGGKTEWTNVVTACHECNNVKSNRIAGRNFPEPLSRPKPPTTLQLQRISQEMGQTSLHNSWLDYLQGIVHTGRIML